tara:strand:- start:16904 stop:17173 length:270 start_codon:yes stop_codon:yes gene_type:complete
MSIIRIFGYRLFHAFKRPPPSYMFKRNVVPSDFDIENEIWSNDKYINKKEFEKPGNKKGSELYYPKYGGSIYDDKIKNQIQERYNSRED